MNILLKMLSEYLAEQLVIAGYLSLLLYSASSQIQMQQPTRTIRGTHNHYTIANLIGQGQFGKVYKGSNEQTKQAVAIKAIRRSKFARNDKLKQLLQREMEVLTQFTHPHVIQLIELVVDSQDVFLVYQYCEGGTLQDKITLNQQLFIPYFAQIIEALCAAQVKGIIHRDIKPANILFKNNSIKLADWGFSRLLSFGQTTCSFIGSPAYMAPEVLKGEEYSLKADVWSLGVVAFECLFGECPWSSKSIGALSNQIGRKPLHFPQGINISKTMQRMLSVMLNADPETRPCFRQVRNMINVAALSSPKWSKSQAILDARQGEQQMKIVSCVFFLQLIQWSRKHISCKSTLLIFVGLIQQNLLKLKSELKMNSQIREVWLKQLKVITEMKIKIKRKIARQHSLKKRQTQIQSTSYLCNTQQSTKAEKQTQQIFTNEGDDELNPEAEWQVLVKEGIKFAIAQLEWAYAQGRESRKEQSLVQINVLLDLVLFKEQPEKYLRVSFGVYNSELVSCSCKSLLRLINSKLVRINALYY